MRRAALLAGLALAGCSRPAPPPAVEAARPASSPPREATVEPRVEPVVEPPAPTPPRKLEAPGELVELDVPGFAPAVVHLPLGTTTSRPLLVATHGNYDRPDWQCSYWGDIVKGRAFVLCPRGVPRGDSPSRDDLRFEYATNASLEKELDAAVDALAARFPEFVDRERAVFTGFSLGAIMGTAIAARHPGRWPRLVLIEGGFDKMTPASARAFLAGGGARILYACGQPGCAITAASSVRIAEKAGLAARVVSGGNEGHTYGGRVEVEVRKSFDWLVEDDARWLAP